jgi:hypothetical protein
MLQSQNPYSPERIDALTQTLSTMDPRARQQYAAQHKDDPAVVAVALNVNNILRAAENNKAMQAGQQQPKVVDQEIAGMAPPPQHMARLPEQQGIAQLQAPNIEHMADGGIAGYPDGGSNMAAGGGPASQLVFNNEPVMRMAGGGMPTYKDFGSVNAPFEDAFRTTLRYEGGYVENDAGKGPSKFGINKAANPDVDIKNLTKDKARELYKKRYWDAIGGDSLAAKDPALAKVAFDTAVNMGPEKAKQLVEQSKGNPAAMLQMRQQHYDKLVETDPKKFAPYKSGWDSRLADLATSIIPSAEAGELPKEAPKTENIKESRFNGYGGTFAGAGSSGLAAIGGAYMPQLLDKFAPSLVNDPKALAQTARAMGTAGGVTGAVPMIGGLLSTGAANALSNATPEQLSQLQGDIGSDTGFAAAIMNPENRAPENAPKMPYGEQMKNVAKAIVQHPDIDAMRKKKEEEKAYSYDPNKMEPVSPDEFGSAVGIPEPVQEKAVEVAKEALPEKKGFSFDNEDLVSLGLRLMANKSRNLFTAAGEAGIGALADKKEREKAASEKLYKEAQTKYNTAYAEAIERGAKEKNEQYQAESLIQKAMSDWDKNNKITSIQDPTARMREEQRIREQIYANMGIKPIMTAQAAPAGGGDFRMVGVRG